MKKIFICIGVLIVAINAQAQTTAKKNVNVKPTTVKPAVAILKTETDSFSYALGYNIGNNLKQQGVDQISNAAIQKGLDDAFHKKAGLLTEQQANTSIQQRFKELEGKKAEAEKEKGKAFLAANGKRSGVITLPDGLQYEIVKKSDSTILKSPTIKDTVVANYAGKLIDGKEFDNSYKRGEPLSIPVGGVIKGWTEALQLMHVGDKWKVYIPSDLGYGDRGAGTSIPGGATLVFEMELLGIKPAK